MRTCLFNPRSWGLSMLMALAVLVAGMPRPAAAAAPVSAPAVGPSYTVKPCCQLCPNAHRPAAYAASKYLGTFRQLVQGRNDWLYRSDIDLATHFDVPEAGLQQLHRLVAALRRHGTTVVMVYQPPRGLMDPAGLTTPERHRYDHAAALRAYRVTLQRMRSVAGLVVPPLDRLALPDKHYEYYFRRDHHWTPQGAKHTAAVVAATLRKLPAFAGIPHTDFSTRQQGILPKRGTLQKVATQLCGGSYSMQYVPAYVTQEKGGGGGLLGKQSFPQVALVGTSNSDAKGGYDFNGLLEQALGVDILDVAISGGSFDGSLLHYLQSQDFQKHPPKIIIWETPYQDFPDTARKAYKVVRQALPLMNDGCHGRPAALRGQAQLHAGVNELLFNGNGRIKPLVSRDYLLDFQLSDHGVKDLHAIVWYLNGMRESLKLHFNQYVDNGGRFVADLRTDTPEYANATVMGVTVDMSTAPVKPLSISARLCVREDAPQSAHITASNP